MYADENVAAAERPTSTVDECLDYAADAEAFLGRIVTEAEGRLQPVVRPSVPSIQKEQAIQPDTQSRSQLAERLRSHADAVRSQANRLLRLMERLDL